MAIEDGVKVLDEIFDKEAAYWDEHGKPPTKVKLPVHSACQLMKARGDLGKKLFASVTKLGLRAFEKRGLYGLEVELIYGRDAVIVVEGD